MTGSCLLKISSALAIVTVAINFYIINFHVSSKVAKIGRKETDPSKREKERKKIKKFWHRMLFSLYAIAALIALFGIFQLYIKQ